jgi:hypothetical protein
MLPERWRGQANQDSRRILRRTDLGVIDCLGEVAGIGGYDHVLQASEPVTLACGTCRMLSLEALIRSKEARVGYDATH